MVVPKSESMKGPTMTHNAKSFAAACILATMFVASPQVTSSQEQDTVAVKPARITLTDGSELIGTITGEDSVSIFFTTVGNIPVTVPKKQVETRELLAGQITGGRYVRSDPNYTRLLIGPTARSLKSGQGYFSAYEIFFPFFAIGIADVVTLAGGISLFPGAEDQIFYIAPKITPVQTENFSAAGGLLYINSTAGGHDGVGIYYGAATFGSQDAALTAGLGWGFSGSDVADNPVVMLGGELRVSNSVKLITENWIPPNSDIVLVSFGIRFFGERLAADLGFMYPAGSETHGFPFMPWLGFAYNFGN
jgi:hypothetical protein